MKSDQFLPELVRLPRRGSRNSFLLLKGSIDEIFQLRVAFFIQLPREACNPSVLARPSALA